MNQPAGSDPTLAPRTEALIAFYKEQCDHGRHTENQRHGVSTMLLAAAGVLLSVIGALKFSIHAVPLAICIVGLGIFGKAFMEVYERKWDEAGTRRNHYRRLIQSSLNIPDAPAPEPPPEESKEKEKKRLRLRDYWTRAFNALVLIGILCILLSLAVAWARASNAGQCDYGDPLVKQLAGCDFSKETD